MVKNSMDSSLGVSLTVSAVCCPVEAGEDPAGIARYVQAGLGAGVHPAGNFLFYTSDAAAHTWRGGVCGGAGPLKKKPR